ncbi:DUF3570 domain-containing protein [Mucilaginibacter sp. ZT4R22]|uniref:DUF3570 domain-containing protein n=1 Tax=Mucilaginibacter pankratovii TaxID=2772110 RepID=A0ABR7WKR2_9SPHI|nr:DUF3570 domain-containing protein [Mucilaginibacter pankratovii]MBD1362924.1 DUF3570 domain-containing protein [Mucilaginibacter pankratovii]
MKKIYLTALGFAMLCRPDAFAQTGKDNFNYKTPYTIGSSPKPDTSHFNPRKFHLDEINFVSSYYSQTGIHSPVTGGIGSQEVTDVLGGITLNFVRTNRNDNKNTLTLGLGIDYHSSASQAFVSTTGASRRTGRRIYPSIDWSVESKKTGNVFGVGAYLSNEYNYKSVGGDVHYALKTDNRNGEFTVKLQGYFDRVTLIYPSEFVPPETVPSEGSVPGAFGHADNFGTSPRRTFTASFGYSQVINSRLQIALLADLVRQNGLLSLPFHRVYLSNGQVAMEKLPSSRFKIPIGFRANYFAGDNIIIRSYYRYFSDNWGTRANTANLEVVYKFSPFFSISPFYRYYTQNGSKYFAPYAAANPSQEFYTSNYDYAKLNSHFLGAGFRIAPPNGVLGWKGLHDMEIRYGHYSQNTDLVSDVFSINLGFK